MACNMLRLTLFAFCVCFFSGAVNSEPTWQTLRVTWGVNFLSPSFFSKLPRTENDTQSAGFAKVAGTCADGSKFLGHRYMKGDDPAAIVIYDVNGYIAGIQQGIPKNEVWNASSYTYDHLAAYQLDKIGEKEFYFLTAYFVDPSIICHGGRTKQQYLQDGTGTGLYIQNGTDPVRDSVQVPLYEKDMKETKWVKGGCFRTMGVHYWYNMSENMSCSDMLPFTAIYNRGKLTNFAFVSPGNYEFSKRFEYPPYAAISLFLTSPLPKCVHDIYEYSGGYSSMHVYFTVRPWNLLC